MKVFHVELTALCVVVAEDEREAESIAENNSRDIMDSAMETCVLQEIKSLSSLPYGVKPYETPYGTYVGTSKTLAEILPEEDPFVDTKTIDMFTGNPHGARA